MSVFFYEPFYDFERLVDEAFLGERGGHQLQTRLGTNPRSVDGAMRAFRPRMDLHEDPDRNLVTASFELPGVSREEIDIQVQNNRLTISTETKRSSEHSEDGYAVRERSFGKYSRALQLPQGIKEEDIKASIENGVLTVTFPKSTPEQAAKKITIS